jgi:serine protease Do
MQERNMKCFRESSSVCLGSGTLFFILTGLFNSVFAASGLPDFADLVEANADAIVEISALQTVATRRPNSEELEEFLRQLDPDDIPPAFRQETPPELQRRVPLGSGFLISRDGYVITNFHVVSGATDITVHLNDRREYRADIVGLDEPSDIALLKVAVNNLPFAEFGDSDQLRVGEWVLAIGSPFGLQFSAAAGIVSAKGRSVPGRSSYNYMSFIQSDVAINQGNSGGPLFNLDGKVVGINSQIFSSTGGSDGISFSIPSNVAMNVIAQLKESGLVQRGLLGVLIQPVSFALSQSFGMDRPMGAFVDDVQKGSPAELAGVKAEDIILEYNGIAIQDSTDLPFFVGQDKPGTRSELLVFRDGKRLPLTVTLGSSPTNQLVEVLPNPVPEKRNRLGVVIESLSREARQSLGSGGVRVTSVEKGPAQDAGLREGDVIVSLNRQEINNVEEFETVSRALPDSGFVQLRLIRDGRGTTLALEMK